MKTKAQDNPDLLENSKIQSSEPKAVPGPVCGSVCYYRCNCRVRD